MQSQEKCGSELLAEFVSPLLQERPSTPGEELAVTPVSLPAPSVIPSIGSVPIFRSSSALTPVVCDDRAISTLLELILVRGKISVHEQARRMGVNPNSVRQYISGRRTKPSLKWFIKFCQSAGAKVTIEFPER